MNEPEPEPEIEALVRAHLDRQAERVDPPRTAVGLGARRGEPILGRVRPPHGREPGGRRGAVLAERLLRPSLAELRALAARGARPLRADPGDGPGRRFGLGPGDGPRP